jgi:AcrR family transcriptional regulator
VSTRHGWYDTGVSEKPTTAQPAPAASREPTPLRVRQATAAREAILEALVALLEREEPDQISMDTVAERAGTSRRTLYRYFPTRDDLLAAAGDWIFEHRIKLPPEVCRAQDIPDSFIQASDELARHPRLARVLLNSTAGQSIHGTRRARRTRSIQAALAEITNHLPDDQATERAALISHLCSSRSWITLQDETAIDSAAARRAVAWALRTLIDELQRQHNTPLPRRSNTNQQRQPS